MSNKAGSKQSPRGGKPNRGKQSNKQKFVRDGEAAVELLGNRIKCHDNDWRWYAQDAQLVKDFANFPFGQAVGSQLGIGYDDVDQSSVPGIFTFAVVPSIGKATSAVDPINVAMRKTFNALRKANSGRTNYEAPNLMMYIIAVSQAASYLMWLKRSYGVMNTFSPVNLFKPQALITAMGLDYSSIQSNLNDFRGYINQFAARLNQVVIPAVYSYTRRQEWLYEAIYQDAGTKKAQLYMYVPAGFFRYVEGTASTADFFLQYVPLTANMTFDDVITYGNAMLDSILSSQDFNIMAGDILKAYGDAGVYKPTGITETYTTAIVYDAEVLSQMENATAIGYPVTYTESTANGYVITEDKTINGGFLVSDPVVKLPRAGGLADTPAKAATYYQINEAARVLNFHHESPTPEQTMVATRLTAFTDMGPNGSNCVLVNGTVCAPLYTAGSEWVAAVYMWDYGWTTTGAAHKSILQAHGPFYYRTTPVLKQTCTVDSEVDNVDTDPDMNAMTVQIGATLANSTLNAVLSSQLINAHLSMFDWHPAICVTPALSLELFLQGTEEYPLTDVFVKSGSDYIPVNTIQVDVTPVINTQAVATDLDAIQMDIDVYGIITAQNQANMNWVALLSEFDAG